MGVFIKLFFWKKNLFFLNEGKQKAQELMADTQLKKLNAVKKIYGQRCVVLPNMNFSSTVFKHANTQ